MNLHFWGTRGSLPVATTAAQIRHKVLTAVEGAIARRLQNQAEILDYIDHELSFDVAGSFGGNTSCMHVESAPDETEHVILDMGSGARPLGDAFLARHGTGKQEGQTYHFLISHMHWDHIMGFPFFMPAYLPGNRIIIHGCHADLEYAIRRQQEPVSFPVDLSAMRAKITFNQLKPGSWHQIAGLNVLPKLQIHAGDSYGYRIEHQGKSLIYTTDSEHHVENHAQRISFVEFMREADLVVFDTMYSLVDAISAKANWGHSSNMIAVELCQMARCKRLCLFHHDPACDDTQLQKLLAETRRLEQITRDQHVLDVVSAYDGLVLPV